jgi:integrase
MAYIRKLENGTWQAQVQHLGKRISKTFDTKGEAGYWAKNQSQELKTEKQTGIDLSKTFKGVALKYLEEVSPKKRGERWERIRIKALMEDELFATVKFAKVDSTLIAKWRDSRLKLVQPSTVNRDLNLLSAIFTKAIKEWKIITDNPVGQIERPKNPPARERVLSQAEIDDFLKAVPYNAKTPAKTLSERVAVAFLFAIASGMRCGELCSITKADINGNVARLKMTKNGLPRNVPLSKEAVRLLGLLPDCDGPLFGLKSAQVDTTFRKIKSEIGGVDYTFHDTRRTAITRMAKKIDVMDLAKLVGHTDLKMTLRYYQTSAEDIAKLLD